MHAYERRKIGQCNNSAHGIRRGYGIRRGTGSSAEKEAPGTSSLRCSLPSCRLPSAPKSFRHPIWTGGQELHSLPAHSLWSPHKCDIAVLFLSIVQRLGGIAAVRRSECPHFSVLRRGRFGLIRSVLQVFHIPSFFCGNCALLKFRGLVARGGGRWGGLVAFCVISSVAFCQAVAGPLERTEVPIWFVGRRKEEEKNRQGEQTACRGVILTYRSINRLDSIA